MFYNILRNDFTLMCAIKTHYKYCARFWPQCCLLTLIRCDETLHRAHRTTTSRRERRVTGRFTPPSVCPFGRIQRFLLIQLKSKHVFRCGASARRNNLLYSNISALEFASLSLSSELILMSNPRSNVAITDASCCCL